MEYGKRMFALFALFMLFASFANASILGPEVDAQVKAIKEAHAWYREPPLVFKWMHCQVYHSAFCIGHGGPAVIVSESTTATSGGDTTTTTIESTTSTTSSTTTTLPCISSDSIKKCCKPSKDIDDAKKCFEQSVRCCKR